MVSLSCQFDWTNWHIGGKWSTPLGVSVTSFPRIITSWGSDLINASILQLTHMMLALLGGRAFGGSWSVGVSLLYSASSPSMAALAWVDILCQASSTMTDWALWNHEPKLIFPSIHYFCWVFGQCEEKNNEYAKENLQRTSSPVSKENLRHHHSDPWFLILIFRRQKQKYFRFLAPWDASKKILGYMKYYYPTLESEMTNICMGN